MFVTTRRSCYRQPDFMIKRYNGRRLPTRCAPFPRPNLLPNLPIPGPKPPAPPPGPTNHTGSKSPLKTPPQPSPAPTPGPHPNPNPLTGLNLPGLTSLNPFLTPPVSSLLNIINLYIYIYNMYCDGSSWVQNIIIDLINLHNLCNDARV